MMIEDEELKIFCGLLAEAYIDSYIKPSTEWTALPSKDLDTNFDRFKKKRSQIEKSSQKETCSHFGFKSIHPPESDSLYQSMSDFLDSSVISNSIDLRKAYAALQHLLEDSGVLMPLAIQELLKKSGVIADTSKVSVKDKKHIAIQAAAQVIGYEHARFNIKEIKDEILHFNEAVQELMYLNEWRSVLDYDEGEEGFDAKDRAKALEGFIASVNPIPKGSRRGRGSKELPDSQEIILIPGICETDSSGITKINFPKLRIAFCYFTLILSYKSYSSEELKKHPIFIAYTQKIPVYLHSLLDRWISEALEKIAGFLESWIQRFS